MGEAPLEHTLCIGSAVEYSAPLCFFSSNEFTPPPFEVLLEALVSNEFVQIRY